MGSTFNPQILVDKLAKLNSSQASIETLSHWCIFHMNKAKYVVETWAKQFHCSPREQRLAFLYLANDILQNSRRKGSEFVSEFWRVLPDALHDVIDAGDEAGRNSALRLINIWEERKVFGPRPHSLKEEFLGKKIEKSYRDGKQLGLKLPSGTVLDKIISGYHAIYNGQMDEDDTLTKCNNAMAYIEKVDEELSSNMHHPGEVNGTLFASELELQHAILKDSIRELASFDTLRSNLVCQLREAILDQEHKLEHVRNQLQIARTQLEHANTIREQLAPENATVHSPSEPPSEAESREQAAAALYVRQASFSEQMSQPEEESRKSAAAAVAEKLTASTSSAQMLSYVLSSLASEGVIGTARKEPPSSDYSSEKRAKLDGDQPYIPTLISGEPFSTTATTQLISGEPPPPSSPLLLPPPPQYSVPQYVPEVASLPSVPYSYGISPQQQQQSYPAVGAPFTMSAPSSSCQAQQGDGNLYSQPSSIPAAPMPRQ